MITSSLLWLRNSRRNDACPFAARGINDGENALFDHSEQHEAVLSIALPPILPNHAECVIEGEARCLEAHAVRDKVLRCFGIIPFKILILHVLRLSRIQQRCPDEKPKLSAEVASRSNQRFVCRSVARIERRASQTRARRNPEPLGPDFMKHRAANGTTPLEVFFWNLLMSVQLPDTS